MTRFASVVIDVDSTLSQIEGIEWLASRRDAEARAYIAETTHRAMRGDIPLEEVFGKRLALVKPTREELKELAQAYIQGTSPGARESIRALLEAGVRVVLVSGGLLEAIRPLGASVGIPEVDVHAVAIHFDDGGDYLDFDHTSPLARRGGKPLAVQAMSLPAPTLALGDGITDAELKPVVDRFVAFTGVVSHERVVAVADAVITRFDELTPMVLT